MSLSVEICPLVNLRSNRINALIYLLWIATLRYADQNSTPDSKVHGANMGPTFFGREANYKGIFLLDHSYVNSVTD